MPADPRFCSNCRAELPAGAEACPDCGVFAGDLYDERMHRPRTRFAMFALLLILALATAGAAIWWNAGRPLTVRQQQAEQRKAPPRAPGAVRNEAEAIRIVRRHLVSTTGTKTDCIAILGHGAQKGGYVVTAVNRCENIRLGKWRVDVKSGEVTRAR